MKNCPVMICPEKNCPVKNCPSNEEQTNDHDGLVYTKLVLIDSVIYLVRFVHLSLSHFHNKIRLNFACCIEKKYFIYFSFNETQHASIYNFCFNIFK